jgi:hypothetical protein
MEEDTQSPPHKLGLTGRPTGAAAPPQEDTDMHVQLVLMMPSLMALAWAQLPSGWLLDGSLREGLLPAVRHWYEMQGGSGGHGIVVVWQLIGHAPETGWRTVEVTE